MEAAASVRRAALAAVDDVEPEPLRERIEDRIDGASMAPGVLTLISARVVRDQRGDDAPTDGLADRAAGVQLIYEGLRLTRRLVHDNPWSADEDGDENLDVLIADILVSRGFYLLARTDAAGAAVGVVRAFGRDQTVQQETAQKKRAGTETDPEDLDTALEADVLELAVITGTAAAGGHAPDRLRDYASELASDGLPATNALGREDVTDTLDTLATTETSPGDGVRTSADH